MARLPTPGSDDDIWGDVLNQYLLIAHTSDGTLRDGAVTSSKLTDGGVTTAKLSDASVTSAKLASSDTPASGEVLSYNGSSLEWIAQSATPDATTTSKGVVQLSGDLGGTASAPTVPSLSDKASLSANNTFTGYQTFQNTTNSTTSFRIQNATGTSLFTIDTTNTKATLTKSSGSVLELSNGTDATQFHTSANGSLTLLSSNGSGNISINPEDQLNLGTANVGSINIGRTDTNITATHRGSWVSQPVTDTTNAFQVQRTNADPLLTTDTSNNRVKVGNDTAAAGTDTTLFVVDSAVTANAPTGLNGGMYYDTTLSRIRFYENGAWANVTNDRSVATKIVADGSTTQNPQNADYTVPAAATNAQVTINAAISALPAGGGVVHLLEGTYIIDGTILIPSNVTLAGAGDSTVIKLKDGINAAMDAIDNSDSVAGNTNIIIQNLKLDGNKANNTAGYQLGIFMSKVAPTASGMGARIINVTAQNFRNDGFYIYSCYNTQISNCYATGNDVRGFYLEFSERIVVTGNHAISNTSGRGIWLYRSHNNIVSSNVTSGDVTGITVAQGSNNTVLGNTVLESTAHGIEVSGVAGNTADSNLISGNKVHNNGGSGSSHGIRLSGDSNNNSIIGNDITDTAGTGVAIRILDSTCDNNYLEGNRFSGTGASSITDSGTGTIFAGQIVDTTGAAMFKNTSDSTAAFRVANAASTNLLTVNTTHQALALGSNIRGINQAISGGATSVAITFGTAHADANYSVFCTPNYNTTCWVTAKATTGFTINFGTAAGASDTVDWFVVR